MSLFRRMFNRKENDMNEFHGAQLNNNYLQQHRQNAKRKNGSATMNNSRTPLSATTKFSMSNDSNFSVSSCESENLPATMLPHSEQNSYQQHHRGQNNITTASQIIDGDGKRNLSVLQLTSLWEHVLRTRTLPSDINPYQMFEEFLERLRDPEWQVRQHALKVLLDVLLVIGQKADIYFSSLISQLVENLGHPAPTVRKGALDCLRVYLAETAMPESIILEILDIGLNQRSTNEPFGGRLTCGVMLSLPALVQATMHTAKRNIILRTTIETLIRKTNQMTNQEMSVRILAKFQEMLGIREFKEFMSANEYRQFEMLCNVYGIPDCKQIKKAAILPDMKSWQMMSSFDSDETFSVTTSEGYWRSSDEEEKIFNLPARNGSGNIKISAEHLEPHFQREDCNEKVIMETEIKINDDTLTMRILEAKEDCQSNSDGGSSDDEKKNRNKYPASSAVKENSGFIQVLTDSEVDEINGNMVSDYNTPRTPKRVTFGGEIVKMRTPDSDTVAQSDVDFDFSNMTNRKKIEENKETSNTLNFLTVDIPNDNTKPISGSSQSSPSSSLLRPKSAQVPKNAQQNVKSLISPISSDPSASPNSPSLRRKLSLEEIRSKSTSPKSPFKRISISPVDDIVSPKPMHKEIEVLHNLQREISPNRPKRPQSKQDDNRDDNLLTPTNNTTTTTPATVTTVTNSPVVTERIAINSNYSATLTPPAVKSWEDLGIVQPEVIKDLKSGDWRYRAHAICSIEEALKSSDNLALVQPTLDTLLRTLLSSEKNIDVLEDKIRVIMNLISRLPLDNLEDRTTQIITGLCRQGGSGANRISKALMQRLPAAVIVLKLLSEDFLHARSSRFRENALQMVMYALMTFPSTYFDTATCVTRATHAALDPKKRVRQAALDVLAILGQVISPRTVLDIVEKITNSSGHHQSNEMNDLAIAIKARLSRKQLPNVSADGYVQYALRVPSPPQSNETNVSGVMLAHIGADIKWISAGNGSVSPASMKRRTQRYQQNHSIYGSTDPNWARHYNTNGNGKMIVGQHNDSDENMRTHQNSSQNGEPKIGLLNGRRVFSKTNSKSSCSDSSYDGRSSDSIKGCSHNNSRHTVTSRFPVVERLDITGTAIERQSYCNPYEIVLSNSNRFNCTHPKSNYSVHKKASKQQQQDANYQQQQQQQYNINYAGASGSNSSNKNPKRFMNVEKFIMQPSNKPQQEIHTTTDHHHHHHHHHHHNLHHQIHNNFISRHHYHDSNEDLHEKSHRSKTTISDNRFISSQVPTNSSSPHQQQPPVIAQNSISKKPSSGTNVSEIGNDSNRGSAISRKEDETDSKLQQASTPILALEDDSKSSPSKSDSRPTSKQIVTPISRTSRPESSASDKLINIPVEIEEGVGEIALEKDDNLAENSLKPDDSLDNDTSRTDDVDKESIETVILNTANENNSEKVIEIVNPQKSEVLMLATESKSLTTTPAHSPIPTVEVKPMTRASTIAKSYDSIYETSIPIGQQDIDNQSNGSSGSSTDYPPSVAASLDFPLRNKSVESKTAQHTPLMRKSKTTLFGNRNRRVSPIKQSMKLTKPELFPQTLMKFDKPRDGMNLAIDQLESSNWETVMTGIVSMVRLMRFHPEHLDNNIHVTCVQLAKTVKNLRSQVARAACQASIEFFATRNKGLEQECDELVGNLLNRTADTNRFIRADATLALESMCDNLQPPKVIHLLTTRGAQHLNAIVRTATAKLLNRLVERLGCGVVFGMQRENREKLFVTSANLLMEGSLETRNYAKALLRVLCDHPNYKKSLIEFIPTRTYRNIEKTLKTIVSRGD